MPGWLRDPVWQFVAAVVGVVAVVATIWVWQASQSDKALSYEVLSAASVVNVQPGVQRAVEVRVNGVPVSDPSLAVVRLRNTGDAPIPSVDFEGPLTLRFDGGSVLSAEVTDTQPPRLTTSLSFTGELVSLAPLLFNAGDSVTVTALLDKQPADIAVDGRIIGVSRITRQEPDDGNLEVWQLAVILGMTVLAVLVLIRLLPSETEQARRRVAELEARLGRPATTEEVIQFTVGRRRLPKERLINESANEQ
jgi:hypothetical protein